MSEHGTAISTFFERAQPGQPHILVIRTETSTFGAVLGDAPVRRKGRQGWFGSASTFVLRGDEVYRRGPDRNDMYIAVMRTDLTIGGPEAAIFLTDGMQRVISEPCATFGSPAFVTGTAGARVLDVELYCLDIKTDR
jgi:hypothetical protein